MKKLLAIIFAAALCFALGVTAMAANDPTTLTVGGVQVVTNGTATSNTNGNGWSYENGTLTLNGYDGGAIYVVGNLEIFLVQDTVNQVDYSAFSNNNVAAIYVNGSLKIGGAGKLVATGGNNMSGTSSGILLLSGTLTINSGTVEATGGAIYTDGAVSCGIFVGGSGGCFNMNGGTVIAKGGKYSNNTAIGGNSYGIYVVSAFTATGGSITAEGFDNGVSKAETSSGIEAASFNVSGNAVINATGGRASESCGIKVYSTDASVSDNAKVTATAGYATDKSRGFYCSGELNVSGTGTLIATGADMEKSNLSQSYGIYSGTVVISGGTVTAAGGSAVKSYGLSARSYHSSEFYGIKITGGTVTATAGDATEQSYGFLGSTSHTSDVVGVIISGGTVTATGGNVSDTDGTSYGICSVNSFIKLQDLSADSKVIAQGNTKALSFGSTLNYPDAYTYKTSATGTETAGNNDDKKPSADITYLEIFTAPPIPTVDITVTVNWIDGLDNAERSEINVIMQKSSGIPPVWENVTDSSGNTVTFDVTPPSSSDTPDQWTYTVTLPEEDANGNDIIYGVKINEVPAGYKISYSDDTFTVTLTKTFTVTYNGNGNTFGTAPVDSNVYSYGDRYVVAPFGDLKNDGHKLIYWCTNAAGTGTLYRPGDPVTVTEDVTLYAIWTEIFTVTYDANGGEGGFTDPEQYAAGEFAAILPTPATLKREGYVFDCWNTQADGSGVVYVYEDEDKIEVNGNVTLYAHWLPLIKVTFNAGEGTGTMDFVYYDPFSGTFTLPQCTFTPPTGKIFAGWSIPEREGVFASGDEVEFPGDIELTAVWKDAPVVEEDDPCKHEFDKEGICKHCKIQVIDHTKPENETNPNTGAPAPLAAIAAAVLLGAVCLGKRK